MDDFRERYLLDNNPYFQDAKYFEKGVLYRHILCRELKLGRWYEIKLGRWYEKNCCVIDENCLNEFAGMYVSHRHYGFGDNANVKMNFLQRDHKIKTFELDYVGRTRFRQLEYSDILMDLKMFAKYLKGSQNFQQVFANPHLVFLVIEYLYCPEILQHLKGFIY